jgi:hypothetical protein
MLAETSRKPALSLFGLCGSLLLLLLLLDGTGGHRFSQHWRRFFLRDRWRGDAIIDLPAPTIHTGTLHAHRKRSRLIGGGTGAEADAVVVDWFRLPPRYGLHAVD